MALPSYAWVLPLAALACCDDCDPLPPLAQEDARVLPGDAGRPDVEVCENPPSSKLLAIPYEHQQGSYLCWLATGRMIIDFIEPTPPPSQCELATPVAGAGSRSLHVR